MKKLTLICFLFYHSGVASADNLGKQLYDNACSICHAPNKASALKAPAAFNEKAWAKRMRNAKKRS